MTTKRTRLRDSRSWRFDLGLCVLGLALLTWSLPFAWDGGWKVGLAALIGVPLVVVIARFPMVLDNEDGSIEIGFDSIVLIYLLCTFDALPSLAVWGLGVLATRAERPGRGRPPSSSTSASASSPARWRRARCTCCGGRHSRRASWWPWWRRRRPLLRRLRPDGSLGRHRAQTPVRRHLVQPGTWLAVACFVPFDLLAASSVMLRSNPLWTLVLLVVPLATLLINTRAIVHGREHARRLSVLFEAAVRVQALREPGLVIEALVVDARRLASGCARWTCAARRPFQIGAQVRRGKDALWVVATSRDHARSTVDADQHALDALTVDLARRRSPASL